MILISQPIALVDGLFRSAMEIATIGYPTNRHLHYGIIMGLALDLRTLSAHPDKQ